ncbi:MAG: DEAD/DEAH box helicase, partial [Gammaproteobacteria bacterium]|nr:DEAD/DEAH box helicase [Gammaproteobacteria bacterium]
IASRYGLRRAQVEPVLGLLESRGVLVRGEIRPGGVHTDWCDAEVLRRLKRMTLARLRNEVAAVEPATLGRFLPDWHGLLNPRQGPDALLEAVTQLQGLPLSWQTLVGQLLPARVAGFRVQQLDMLCASGAIVWVGHSALGPRDGRIVLYLRNRFHELAADLPDSVESLTSVLDERLQLDGDELAVAHTIVSTLGRRGACFLLDLEDAVQLQHPGVAVASFERALWALVWSGLLSNDTTAPLQQLGRRRSSTRVSAASRAGAARRNATLAGGRWSLLLGHAAANVNATEQALARARMLLDRYGIVSRDAAASESLPGGFGAVYPVLKQMEESGRVRRGHFIDGLAGAQFAQPGAVDRLRAARGEDDEPWRDEHLLLIPAIDPANPFGSLLPWPGLDAVVDDTNAPRESRRASPRRVNNAWVVLARGLPALYVNAAGTALLSFASTFERFPEALPAAARALTRLPRRAFGGRRSLLVEQVDGVPVRQSPLYEVLREAGFRSDYKGLGAPLP